MGKFACFDRFRLLLLIILLSACVPEQSLPAQVILTSTPRPTETRVPTVTPIFGSVPRTGIGAVLATPIPTYTLLPNQPIYDPLKATATAQAALPPTPSSTPPPAEPADAAEAIPTGKLTGGVLGLIPSPQGLWAMRPNGEQMTLLTADPIDALAISPGGTLAVYLTHTDGSVPYTSRPFGYTLMLMTLYNNLTYPVARIDPPDISAQSTPEVFDAAVQGIAAYEHQVLSWSPDGGRVAYTASIDAPPGQPASSDIYIYTPSSGSIRRLTTLDLPDGPAHPYDLHWSPDGGRLYFSAAYHFSAPGTAASTVNAGTWVASMDGSLKQVADGAESRGENLLDWLPANTLLLSSNDPVCGESRLRTVSLQTGKVTMLWQGCFTDFLFDRAWSEVLVSISAADAAAMEETEGLYLMRLNQTEPVQVTTTGFARIYRGDLRASWYGYRTGEGLFAISRTGEVKPSTTGVTLEEQNGVLLRPLSRITGTNDWLWTGDPSGLYLVRQGQEPRLVIDMEVQGWTSSPSYRGLYFFYAPGENGLQLYAVNSSDWQPYPIDDRLRAPGSIHWAP